MRVGEGAGRADLEEDASGSIRWPRSPTTAPRAGGEPLAILLRPGNAGSNTASEHIEATKLALAQLPRKQRRRVLIRTDSGGGTHEFLAWLTRARPPAAYSVGMTITDDIARGNPHYPGPGLGAGLRCRAARSGPARGWPS